MQNKDKIKEPQRSGLIRHEDLKVLVTLSTTNVPVERPKDFLDST